MFISAMLGPLASLLAINALDKRLFARIRNYQNKRNNDTTIIPISIFYK